VQSQILRRQCDNCGLKVDLPLGHMRPEHEAELGAWIVMSKEHTLRTGEQPQVLTKHACCYTCGEQLLKNQALDIPKNPVN
jgi:hypothetical protein